MLHGALMTHAGPLPLLSHVTAYIRPCMRPPLPPGDIARYRGADEYTIGTIGRGRGEAEARPCPALPQTSSPEGDEEYVLLARPAAGSGLRNMRAVLRGCDIVHQTRVQPPAHGCRGFKTLAVLRNWQVEVSAPYQAPRDTNPQPFVCSHTPAPCAALYCHHRFNTHTHTWTGLDISLSCCCRARLPAVASNSSLSARGVWRQCKRTTAPTISPTGQLPPGSKPTNSRPPRSKPKPLRLTPAMPAFRRARHWLLLHRARF
jgi:hypothetical protein